MSAVFRKGGDVTFLVEEMKAVFDPEGRLLQSGGVYMPSLVAELGMIVEDHLKTIGLMHDPEMSDAQRALIAEKRRAYEENRAKKKSEIGGKQPPRRRLSVAARRYRSHRRRREFSAFGDDVS